MSPAAFLRDRALSVAVAIVCAIAIGSVVADSMRQMCDLLLPIMRASFC